MNNRKIIKNIRVIIIIMTILLIIVSISFGITYSNFIYKTQNHKAVEMFTSKLDYGVYINNNLTNNVITQPGSNVLNIKINSNNSVSSYYKLVYNMNSNLDVYYINNVTPYGLIASFEEIELQLYIVNNSNYNITLYLNVSGGYNNNELNDVIIPENYNEITNQIKVGDYISYNPNGIKDITMYSLSKEDSGCISDQNIYLKEINYRIFNINNDGTIDIISENSLYIDASLNSLYLSSSKGYNNGNSILDNISNTLYGNNEKVVNARNLSINDILSKLKEQQELNEYYYDLDMNSEKFTNPIYYDLLINNKKNWLSSNYIKDENGILYYGLYSVNNNKILLNNLYDSDNNNYVYGYYIRPVIKISSNIKLHNNNSNWNIN